MLQNFLLLILKRYNINNYTFSAFLNIIMYAGINFLYVVFIHSSYISYLFIINNKLFAFTISTIYSCFFVFNILILLKFAFINLFTRCYNVESKYSFKSARISVFNNILLRIYCIKPTLDLSFFKEKNTGIASWLWKNGVLYFFYINLVVNYTKAKGYMYGNFFIRSQAVGLGIACLYLYNLSLIALLTGYNIQEYIMIIVFINFMFICFVILFLLIFYKLNVFIVKVKTTILLVFVQLIISALLYIALLLIKVYYI